MGELREILDRDQHHAGLRDQCLAVLGHERRRWRRGIRPRRFDLIVASSWLAGCEYLEPSERRLVIWAERRLNTEARDRLRGRGNGSGAE